MPQIKFQLKEKAIALRRQGLSYREIMKEVPVAKSTISLWLRSVGLSVQQKQKLTDKKLAAMKRGAEAKHQQRVDRTEKIITEARSEIGSVGQRDFWLIGIMLYWAEGSKEKEYHPGCGVQFTNTDPDMICLFIHWLKEIFDKGMEDIMIDLYIHTLHQDRTSEIISFWIKKIDCSEKDIRHVYYKSGNPKTLRKNIGTTYHGTIRITVKSSSNLNRKIAGWTQGVLDYFR